MKTENQKTAEKLNSLLADYQIYYQNLRGLHWNIKGQQFFMLHAQFENYYNEAAQVIDEIAERILMIGGQPLHTFSAYLSIATLKEITNVSDGITGIQNVLESSRYLLEKFNEILEISAENKDEGTAAMMSGLIGTTEKRIWMLESYLNKF